MPNGMISKQKWCVYFHRKKDGPRDRERARGSTTKKTPRNLDVQMCMWCVDSIYSIPVHSVSHTRSFARSLVHSFARFQLYQNHQNVRISAYLRIQLIWNLNYLHLTLLSLPLPPSAVSTVFTSPQVAQIYSAFLGVFVLFCLVFFWGPPTFKDNKWTVFLWLRLLWMPNAWKYECEHRHAHISRSQDECLLFVFCMKKPNGH